MQLESCPPMHSSHQQALVPRFLVWQQDMDRVFAKNIMNAGRKFKMDRTVRLRLCLVTMLRTSFDHCHAPHTASFPSRANSHALGRTKRMTLT